MRIAALDLGTNTFLLLIADVENGEITQVLCDEVRVVRLGQGVHHARRFHPDALARAEDCFREFHGLIQKHGADKVTAAATSAARDVANGHDLVLLGQRYGIPIDIISGNLEAEYTYQGAFKASPSSPVMVIDIGGGSTEFILGDQSGLVARQSLDIGSVRLSELFVSQHPVPAESMIKLNEYIESKLNGLTVAFPPGKQRQFVAVAGTPTTLAAVDMGLPFESDKVDGYKFSVQRLGFWVQRLASMTVRERQGLAGMDPKRADVIVAGALILQLACHHFQMHEVEVSVRGLRYGLAKRASVKS